VLVFIYSRLRTSDGSSPETYITGTHAIFADFLEALCRLADLKVLPDESALPAGMSIDAWYDSTNVEERRTFYCTKSP
jgi:hypothetical protein